MATLAILKQLEIDLAAAFTELKIRQTIYMSPYVAWEAVQQSLEIQIVERGGTYQDFEGGVRNGDFPIIIAIFYRSKIDWNKRHREALLREMTNIYDLKERVIAALEGSFLTGTLLTRPLRVTHESSVQQNPPFPDFLLKTLTFVGGHNALRPS